MASHGFGATFQDAFSCSEKSESYSKAVLSSRL